MSEITERDSNEVLYSLCIDDVMTVANENDVPFDFTDEEIDRIQKGMEAGLGNCWTEIISAAIDEVLHERKHS